jgi:glutamate-1-semialdehyde 2,1-aminomutase
MSNYFAGGANHPFILNKYPRVKRAQGPFLFTEDGKKLIDLWMGYGTVILGHADKGFTDFVCAQLKKGTLFSLPTNGEYELASLLVKIIPSAKKVKLALSGTEVINYSITLSRFVTGRKKILTTKGSYHGANVTFSDKTSKRLIDKVEFNDFYETEKKLESNEYAAIIVEPVLCNSGVVLPEKGYLNFLRKKSKLTGTILIFDEVVTGFRVSIGGAQEYFKVIPDLSTFSKAMGNGIPISALVGRKRLMDNFTPNGKVFFGGTFYSNPISVASALYTIRQIRKNFKKLLSTSKYILNGINDSINDLKIEACTTSIGSIISIFFSKEPPKNGSSLLKCDTNVYKKFSHIALKHGIFMPPFQNEPIFISLAHAEIKDEIIHKLYESFKGL